MSVDITEDQKQAIIEEYIKNQSALAEQKQKEADEEAARDKKGRYAPKPSVKTPPESTPKNGNLENSLQKDALLDTIEADFREGLKGHAILTELEGLDQRTRIRMLRAVSNTVSDKPRGEGVDPSSNPPIVSTEPKTLAELNNMKDYLHDVQKRTSMFNITDKLRGKT